MKSYKMKINGNDYEVAIKDFSGNNVEVEVNGKAYNVELPEAPKAKAPVINRPAATPTAAPAPAPSAAPAPRPSAGGAAGAVRSPLPGVVLEIKTSVGATVKQGDLILILEAMKMENNIVADKDGTVTQILVNKGDNILEGTELFVIG